MTTHTDTQMSRAQRRHTLSLPKRRYHVALALFLLILVASLLWALSNAYGSKADAEARGSVQIAQLPPEERPSPLDASESDVPDLLAGVVAEGANPTIQETETSAEPQTALAGTVSTETRDNAPRARIIRGNAPVAPPLDPSLVRQTPSGPIPAPNASGLTPLSAYAADPVATNDRKAVSIIIGGLGINTALTSRAIQELPPSVTLSFAAHSDNLQDWIDQARAYGHEVLLEVPMQSQSGSTSELTLLTQSSAEANKQRLYKTLSKAQGYIGLIHYQGDAFLARTDAFSPILSDIKSSGLAFFMDGSFPSAPLTSVADSLQLPHKAGFGIIDPVASPKVIEARLNGLSRAAVARSGQMGVGFVYPETLDAVSRWVSRLENDGLILVPASQTLSP